MDEAKGKLPEKMEYFAIKLVKDSKLKVMNQINYEKFEKDIMKPIKHPNILEIKHISGFKRVGNEIHDFLIFYDFQAGGDLNKLYEEHIQKKPEYVPEETILFWAR